MNACEAGGEECFFGGAFEAGEGHAAGFAWVGATAAEEAEGGLGAIFGEDFGEGDGVIDGDASEFVIGDGACVGAEAEEGGILVLEGAGQGGAIGEVVVEDVGEFGVLDAEGSAADGGDGGDVGVGEGEFEGLGADHAGGADEDDAGHGAGCSMGAGGCRGVDG